MARDNPPYGLSRDIVERFETLWIQVVGLLPFIWKFKDAREDALAAQAAELKKLRNENRMLKEQLKLKKDSDANAPQAGDHTEPWGSVNNRCFCLTLYTLALNNDIVPSRQV